MPGDFRTPQGPADHHCLIMSQWGNEAQVPTPPTGAVLLFIGPAGTVRQKDSAGNVSSVGGGGAGSPATTVTDETTFGLAPVVGGDTDQARAGHRHGTPANPVPYLHDHSAAGGSGTVAHSDTTGKTVNDHHNEQHLLSGDSTHTGLISSAQHPSIATGDLHPEYQRESERGAANGYASLDSGVLVPVAQLGSGAADATKFLRGDRTWAAPAGGGGGEPWEGRVHAAIGSGDPSADVVLWALQNTVVSVAGPTPTGIGTAVGRLQLFRFKTAITTANIRYFGIGAVSAAYTMAIYNAATGARVWLLDPANVVAGWQAVAAVMTLAADTPYWFGLGAKATGTTAGFRSSAAPIANSLGLVSLPGNLNLYGNARYAQVALTAGAWPTTLPALAAAAFASAGATGTLPIVYLDAA